MQSIYKLILKCKLQPPLDWHHIGISSEAGGITFKTLTEFAWKEILQKTLNKIAQLQEVNISQVPHDTLLYY
jgi:hypothetical protein